MGNRHKKWCRTFAKQQKTEAIMLERFWRRMTLRHIHDIRDVSRLIKAMAPEWVEETPPAQDSRYMPRENIKLAIEIYRLRKDAIHTFRQIIWLILAVGAAVAGAVKLFVPGF